MPNVTATDNVSAGANIKLTNVITNSSGATVPSVDTSKIDTYTITYTAIDEAQNSASLIITVKVIAPPSVGGENLFADLDPGFDNGTEGAFFGKLGSWWGTPVSKNVIELDGNNVLEFTHSGEMTATKYDIVGLEAGEKYKLTLKAKKAADNIGAAVVFEKTGILGATGNVVLPITGVSDWQEVAYEFTTIENPTNPGTAKNVLLGLNYNASGTYDNAKLYFDDFSLVKISEGSPEPEVDTTAPEIIYSGETLLNVMQGSTFVMPNVTATDNVSAGVNIKLTNVITNSSGATVPSVDTSKIDTYTITYTAIDEALNSASLIITVKVMEPGSDSTAPKIVYSGETILTVTQGASFAMPKVTATDNVSAGPNIKLTNVIKNSSGVTVSSVDTSKIDTYTITYTAIDEALNSSSLVITVKVIAEEDKEAPVFKYSGKKHFYIEVGDRFSMPEVTAVDNKTKDVEIEIIIENSRGKEVDEIDTDDEEEYTIIYIAKDEAGNTAEMEITVEIYEEEEEDRWDDDDDDDDRWYYDNNTGSSSGSSGSNNVTQPTITLPKVTEIQLHMSLTYMMSTDEIIAFDTFLHNYNLTLQNVVDTKTKLANLPATQKESLQNALENNMPYTSLNGAIDLNMLTEKIGNSYSNTEILSMAAMPTILKEAGVEISESVKLIPAPAKQFVDVPKDHWANSIIAEATQKGYMVGEIYDKFGVESPIVVSDTFVFLDRVLLLNNINTMEHPRSTVEQFITDKGHWAFNSMASVASKLSTETLKTISNLGSTGKISRGLFAQIIFESTNGAYPKSTATKNFSDINNSPYKAAINYCVEIGLLSGTSESEMSPDKYLTRAELASILLRMMK
ncbi:MAG: hypothetical protein ATN31_05250 [Candidatus Epulonipiscioides saccharophilum]|nr:MAG: hypothetical protein ATN31_05250 [Epulopiscium sp. AS2M-Bin001]